MVTPTSALVPTARADACSTQSSNVCWDCCSDSPNDASNRIRGPVIGVDIAGEHALDAQVDETYSPGAFTMWRQRWLGQAQRPGIARILLRAGMVNSAATAAAANLAASDLVLKPPVNEVDLLDWSQFERAVEFGYRYTKERLAKMPVE